jgi:hypothetical protein
MPATCSVRAADRTSSNFGAAGSRYQRTVHRSTSPSQSVDNREDCPQIIRQRWTGGSPSATVQP